MKSNIAVIGSDSGDTTLSSSVLKIAESIGRRIAQKGGVLLCGGRGGIMEAACKGVKKEGGISVGILPSTKLEANQYVDIGLPTGLGHMRNYLVVNTADAVIAVCGRYGTLNELSYAIIQQKPLILVKGTGGIVDEIINDTSLLLQGKKFSIASSAEEAVTLAYQKIKH